MQGINKPCHHGLFGRDLLDALLRLARLGLIEFHEGTSISHPTPADAAGMRRLIERDEMCVPRRPGRPRHRRPAVYFGLTAAGGAAWEAFAEPDWERFQTNQSGRIRRGRFGDRLVHVLAGSERVLNEVLLRGQYGGTLVSHRIRVRRGEIRPFRPTSWKVLPVGYRLSFRGGGPVWPVPNTRPRLSGEIWWPGRWYRSVCADQPK